MVHSAYISSGVVVYRASGREPVQSFLSSSKNLKKQLTYADKKGCPVAVIVGESEIKGNKFTLKNLNSSKENDQKTVSKESLIDKIKKII